MGDFAYFFSFQDINITSVVLGAILLGMGSAWLGSFLVLRKKSLLADSISHAVLPGICMGFMVSGTKDPLFMLLGALLTGWLSLFAVEWLNANTKLKADSTIALVLSVFFGAGIVLLTHIQHSGNAEQSGLEHFMFGKAAAMTPADLQFIALCLIPMLALLVLLHRGLQLYSFDPLYFKSIGFPERLIRFVLSGMTVIMVTLGIQAMGVILMAALLIIPPAAAKFWVNRMRPLIVLSVIFGLLSSLFGTYASFTATHMPTGPWIVVIASFILFISMLLAPQRGILQRAGQQRKNRGVIQRENGLKLMYHLSKGGKESVSIKSLGEIHSKIIKYLVRQGWLEVQAGHMVLTDEGRKKGASIVRKHRLWELYLTSRLGLPADHVHNEAEALEHLISPELERELMEQLGHPTLDPHQQKIPPYES